MSPLSNCCGRRLGHDSGQGDGEGLRSTVMGTVTPGPARRGKRLRDAGGACAQALAVLVPTDARRSRKEEKKQRELARASSSPEHVATSEQTPWGP